MRKFLQTFAWLAAIYGLPLLGRPDQFCSWPVYSTLMAAAILNLTQPTLFWKDIVRKDWRDRRSVVVLVVTGSLIFLVPLIDFLYFRRPEPTMTSLFSAVGLTLMFGGVLFRWYCIWTLGQFFTALVVIQEQHRIIDKGPYHRIRHPSYLGALIMAFGVSVVFHSYFGLAFCVLGFLPAYHYRMSCEEAALKAEIGEPYLEYWTRTWRLIPYLY